MSNNVKYFMYSSTQFKKRKEIEAKIGRKYIPGVVIVNGTPRQYTEIVSSPSNSRYSDALILISGDINTIKYTKEET